MFSLHLAWARTSFEQAAALVPALVPDTWTGGAAQACQRDLDDALAALTVTEGLFDPAASAVAAVPESDALVCWRTP